MARAEYVVACLEGQWTISLNGVPHGPYSSQEAAARAAIDAAHKAEELGHQASVEVQDASVLEPVLEPVLEAVVEPDPPEAEPQAEAA